MSQFTITAIDTTGIQPYIFGSNRLQENIGASELVRLATGQWALEAVLDVAASGKHNIADAEEVELDDAFEIEKHPGELAAEVIYAGGGNIVVLFSTAEQSRRFADILTRCVLRNAPGLSLVVAHRDGFEWNDLPREGDPALSVAVQDLIVTRLAARKDSRLPSSPLLGLGVTAACESTGMVAALTNDGKHRQCGSGDVSLKLPGEKTMLISHEVRAKRWARDVANDALNRLLSKTQRRFYRFPHDIDELGRYIGEESYVAIVHADGNGMGGRIQKIADEHREAKRNRQYIQAMRRFSRNVRDATSEALYELIRALSIKYAGSALPFRPLVFGGDDVTFICQGRLGLPLAALYLDAYERRTSVFGSTNEYMKDMHACAGVAMVKMHYPFARAYALSEELAKSAKSHVRELYKGRKDASAMDWHFATSGLGGNLETIRQREYLNADDDDGKRPTLLMRPVLLHPEDHDQTGRAWFNRIEKLVGVFQEGPVWRDKRNKLKALREALRDGKQAVEVFRRNFELKQLPEVIPGDNQFRDDGWSGNRCGYFDAIELLDHYEPLEVN